MALLGDFKDDYTKTGNGALTSFANKLSFIPFLSDWLKNKNGLFGKIPFLSSTITALVGYVDTVIESAQWLMRGKFASAATVLAAGAVSNTVNGLSGTTMWWANTLTGAATGRSIGTHARALTENIIGGMTGALGVKPTVLMGTPAAIGSIGAGLGAQGPQAPGFRDKIAAERGMSRDQADARYAASDAYVNYGQSEVGRA